MTEAEGSIASHLDALRSALLRCAAATAALFPIGYVLSPGVISLLIGWCFPEGTGGLHYFAPMEAFSVQLRLALVLALAFAYPWNAAQIWRFFLPALYEHERRAVAGCVIASSLLFFCGAAFCTGMVLPALMKFSSGFASTELHQSLGLANFIGLAGRLALAFGLMFQLPVMTLLAVRLGLVRTDRLVKARPYVMTAILIAAGVLTPPDVVSQIAMAVPAWLLFEAGLFAARRLSGR